MVSVVAECFSPATTRCGCHPPLVRRKAPENGGIQRNDWGRMCDIRKGSVTTMAEDARQRPVDMVLTETEVRVLGSLMEKELATPDYYPLSLNALTNACNQKSNRDPVVSCDEETV